MASLRGKKDITRLYNFELGIGTLNAGAGIVYTEYYCSCPSDMIKTNLFIGKGWSANFQIDAISKLGIGVGYSTENNIGAKTYSISFGLGLDAIPTGIDINFNKSNSATELKKLKNIFNE